jgi:hypothetical protein
MFFPLTVSRELFGNWGDIDHIVGYIVVRLGLKEHPV